MNQASFTHEDRKQGIRSTVLVLLLIMAVLLGMFIYRVSQPRILSAKEIVNSGAVMFETPREISAFSLLDTRGEPFTLASLKGGWTFVFFGFTHCPDICPATVAQFNELQRKLGESGNSHYAKYARDTRFLLVSLDPARDTPEVLGKYLDYFNPDFMGATGNFLQLRKFAGELNVAFRKVVTDHDSGDYTIDHGGNVALVNPRGLYQGFFKPPLDVDRMALIYRSVRMQAE